MFARLSAQALAGEIVEIVLPIGIVIAAELMEVVPAVDSGGVEIVEDEADSVISYRMELEDGDVLFARNGFSLLRRVALDLCAWTFDAEIFGGQAKDVAIVEHDADRLAILVEAQLFGPRVLRILHWVSIGLCAFTFER